MYASKENAREAYQRANDTFGLVIDPVDGGQSVLTDSMRFILDFLTAAERKLPTEAAYRRAAKPRKRTKLANG